MDDEYVKLVLGKSIENVDDPINSLKSVKVNIFNFIKVIKSLIKLNLFVVKIVVDVTTLQCTSSGLVNQMATHNVLLRTKIDELESRLNKLEGL